MKFIHEFANFVKSERREAKKLRTQTFRTGIWAAQMIP